MMGWRFRVGGWFREIGIAATRLGAKIDRSCEETAFFDFETADGSLHGSAPCNGAMLVTQGETASILHFNSDTDWLAWDSTECAEAGHRPAGGWWFWKEGQFTELGDETEWVCPDCADTRKGVLRGT